MSKTAWSTNPTLDATAEKYNSATRKYDSSTDTYDGVNYTDLTPTLTAWTPQNP